jgi:hypothetical protein
MGSSPKQTQTQDTKESVGPWAPAQGALQNILGQAGGLLGNIGLTGNENQALAGLAANANTAGQYGGAIQGITDKLFQGGGLGQGAPALQQAWQTAQGALNPIASASLDPMQNPYTQGIIDQVRNQVGSTFANAGRSFSGAHAGSLGANMLPALFNQYNQNAQNAMGASGQLMSGAQGYAQGLDNTYGNQLNAQMQAPGSLQNMNQPQMMALAAEAQRRGIPIQNLADINSLVLPIAQTGREGTSNQTQTQQTKGGGTQAAIGTGLGILGTAGQLGLFSDARMKENARPVGQTFDGQIIYAFNYKGDPRTTMGLMAQEVAQIHPDAVFEGPGGFLMVDYAKATEHAHG